jgi:hypothetical protein
MMEEIPLLNLSKKDPENLLSKQSRIRLTKAMLESEALRKRALAQAHFEFKKAR